MPDVEFEVGRMRNRVLLQARADWPATPGPAGDETPDWQDVGTYRAEVSPLTGHQLFQAQQIKETIDVRIRMRNVGPILPLKNRFVYRGIPMYPESVIRVDNRNEFYEILLTSMQGETP